MSSYRRVGSTPAAVNASRWRERVCLPSLFEIRIYSNAILYWNTLKITDIVDNLKQHGAEIENDTLAHISLLPFKYVVPNGTYFIEEGDQSDSQESVAPWSASLKP